MIPLPPLTAVRQPQTQPRSRHPLVTPTDDFERKPLL